MESAVNFLKCLHLQALPVEPGMAIPDRPGLATQEEKNLLEGPCLEKLAWRMVQEEVEIDFIKGFVASRDVKMGECVEEIRKQLLTEYADSVFVGKTGGSPPVRGPYGEAEIILKPGAVPVKQRPYQMTGERRAAWVALTDQLIADGKLEKGHGSWNSPSFPVPKKKPGQWRLVVDFRALNEATETDAHPLPRIGDILQRQGQFRIWSVLDMKDGYHQVPLKEEHRDLTCMSTPGVPCDGGSWSWA